MSFGKPVMCPACRGISYLYPKGVGYHSYRWLMNCGLCHLSNVGVDAYSATHKELYKILVKLRKRYLDGETSGDLENEINDLAEEFDSLLENSLCECGGRLSIAAKPKCIYCDIEIFDSYFHIADDQVNT